MKAFEFNNKENAVLNKVKSYLSDMGKINCEDERLTYFIARFIKEDFSRLELVAHLDPDIMLEFAEWLSEQEL